MGRSAAVSPTASRGGSDPSGRTGSEAARSATRPANARRAAAAGQAVRTRAPSSIRTTRRAAALGFVLLVLMLAYAYPVRLYLKQEAQIQQLQTSQAQQRARIKSLAQQSAEWNDPAYIKAQARARFFMVPPGTNTYVVQAQATPTPTPQASGSAPSWTTQLWDSIRNADDPAPDTSTPTSPAPHGSAPTSPTSAGPSA